MWKSATLPYNCDVISKSRDVVVRCIWCRISAVRCQHQTALSAHSVSVPSYRRTKISTSLCRLLSWMKSAWPRTRPGCLSRSSLLLCSCVDVSFPEYDFTSLRTVTICLSFSVMGVIWGLIIYILILFDFFVYKLAYLNIIDTRLFLMLFIWIAHYQDVFTKYIK